MLKSQDILLFFIMEWGSRSQLDFVPESYASGLILTAAPTAEGPTTSRTFQTSEKLW